MKYLLICAALLVVFACAMTVIPGLRFSIVLCLAFAALLMLMYVLLKHPGTVSTVIMRLLLIFLILGVLAAAVTGGYILKAAHPASLPQCDVAVVLGAGVHGSVPSLALSERVQAAYGYLTANPAAVAVLTGGQGPGEDITEAACMYRELVHLGIDEKRLYLEEAATSTIENLRFSMALLEAETGSRPARIAIISSEYHLFRACLFAKSLGLEASGVPAHTHWLILRLNYYLREIVAVWKFFVLGP